MSEYSKAQLRQKFLPKRATLYTEVLVVDDVVDFFKNRSIPRDARVHTELDDLGRTVLVAEWQIRNLGRWRERLSE